MTKKRCTAIVLAAGSGSRMRSATAKQFLLLDGKPVIWYALHAVEQSGIIDSCVLVAGEGDIPYARREIVEKYDFRKVRHIVAGGRERWESVYNALRFLEGEPDGDGYVFIHDGARPFLTEELLADIYGAVCRYGACAAAVPVKDTIKLADGDGFVTQTPDRSRMWAVQTPQAFERRLITEAYRKFFGDSASAESDTLVTDDAMVLERASGLPVKLVRASYGNIKITTPVDMITAEALLKNERELSDDGHGKER